MAFVVFPCNIGDIIKDGTGDSYIVDEIQYKKMFRFDGSEREVKKVHLRNKNATPPIYTTIVLTFEEIENLLKQQENNNTAAADVIEVVRCKDCEIPHNKFLGCPYLNGLVPPENHFCSYGKRKEAQA